MVNTYTSGITAVSDGDVTVHNPKSLVGASKNIEILDAEIRWTGDDRKKLTGNENTNSLTFSGTTDTTNLDEYNGTASASESETPTKISSSFPYENTPWYIDGESSEWKKFEYTYTITNNSSTDTTYTIETHSPALDTQTRELTVAGNQGDSIVDIWGDSSDEGHFRSLDSDITMEVTNVDGDTTDSFTQSLEWRSVWEAQTPFQDSLNFPSSPDPHVGKQRFTTDIDGSGNTETWIAAEIYAPFKSAYELTERDFDLPISRSGTGDTFTDYNGNVTWKIFNDGDGSTTGNQVTAEVEAITEGADIFPTTDPGVARDVAGSLSGTVTDGTTTSYTSLTGLEPNSDNELYHQISGSNRAEFEFRFDWQYAYADPTYGTVSFYDESDDVWHEAALADPTDDSLNYNHIRVYNNVEGTWGALDVVDASKSSAIDSHQFYDADAGWVAPRQYDSTPA
jgi:hypothetical protein